MKNLEHQTKQAFYFSLVFYIGSLVLLLFKVSIAPILFSISLLISLIWVLLVLREIMISSKINATEKGVMALFVIIFNIVAGLAYFFLLRKRVIGRY